MKTCSICGIEKSDSSFYMNGLYLRADCKTCFNKKYPNKSKERYIYRREYYKKNKAEVLRKCKEYRDDNKEEIRSRRKPSREYHRNYYKKRIKEDILFRLRHNIRNSIVKGMTRFEERKVQRTSIILGCTFDEFKLYIESLWEEWMNWENYGKYDGTENYGWDLDHQIPISTALSSEEVIKLSHYTNFKPMCSYKNRVSKRSRHED